jgi:hypothetical protein
MISRGIFQEDRLLDHFALARCFGKLTRHFTVFSQFSLGFLTATNSRIELVSSNSAIIQRSKKSCQPKRN